MTIARVGAQVIVGTLATNERDQAKVNFAIRRLQEEINNNSEVPIFSGDSGSGGLKGLVPTPAAGDAAADKFLRADGGWASVFGLSSRPAFAAHKNGANQTIASSTFTKVTFGAEVFDVGSRFDLANARWTPPAGVVVLAAVIHCNPVNTAAGDLNTIALYKNGTQYRFGQQMPIVGAGGSNIAAAAWIDVASGTDFYEVWCFIGPSAGNKEIGGIASITALMGALL
jgi:hypothetical protein